MSHVALDLVGTFLAGCKLHTLADSIRQVNKAVPAELLVPSLRNLAEGTASLLAELEAVVQADGGGKAEAQPARVPSKSLAWPEREAALERVIDGLIRQLVDLGSQISDEKLGANINAALESEALASALGALNGSKKEEITAQTVANSLDGLTDRQQSKPPSAHYVARQPRGTAGSEGEWDADDEYRDDDDPGYRIREIYETELLAELQAKAQLDRAQEEAQSKLAAQAAAAANACDGNAMPPDPAAAAAPADESQSSIAEATGDGRTSEAVAPIGEASSSSKRKKKRPGFVKYPASSDPFYPVEVESVVYDSFNLRVVYERDRTGFEESKEFPIQLNTVVAGRYQIIEYLGSAAFSRAVQCLDLEANKMVCMKIIKNDKDFLDQSLDEIKLLRHINVNADVDEKHVLRLYDYFYHKEHLIIVTELLRDNLYEFSKFNRESGAERYFTLGCLQRISKQVLEALEYIHGLCLIHSDLKPENILIKSYSKCQVKVIDFGSSCYVDDHLSSYVQSRSYRAPEVMLGLPYDEKVDLWSFGCILAELWTGYVLFQNDSVQSLLARIVGIIGDIPYHLMAAGRQVPQFFTQDGQLYQEVEGPICPHRGRRLHLLVPKKTSLRQRMRTDSEEFLDFLAKLLELDATKRITAKEALMHPWLTSCKYPDGL
mmetsp:Transcript_17317/g.40330  ORF Transcript_17317/g.40330 Transcript_17317/m.40330 type:complete len:662 (-) Transcript_17317:35-2020(-)